MRQQHWCGRLFEKFSLARVTIGLKKYHIYTVFPALIQNPKHSFKSLLLPVQALKFNFKDQSLIILMKDSTSLKFKKSVSYAAPFP